MIKGETVILINTIHNGTDPKRRLEAGKEVLRTLYIIKGREVSVTINEKEKNEGRVKITVTRSFAT